MTPKAIIAGPLTVKLSGCAVSTGMICGLVRTLRLWYVVSWWRVTRSARCAARAGRVARESSTAKIPTMRGWRG